MQLVMTMKMPRENITMTSTFDRHDTWSLARSGRGKTNMTTSCAMLKPAAVKARVLISTQLCGPYVPFHPSQE